ncbi:Apoptosis inhibitor 5 [Echinococcus granulosus]|uniref:Apoptosis inhibitor n=1 Tax=Echinococcus granulosus TaxID=6210 RepID=U6IUT9_ECHGR|nr:Apoptosis inhibitor [Echinococcus granulosus]EUB64966.1 Apoptosis inhibitor [Echinococcus granulosus]KAH9285861.1 Apoptosis inhibitor 5 [Echinococcus granulosus]CDS15487.1 apoptosis inhibitor 5 [Echinococcus granulosus]
MIAVSVESLYNCFDTISNEKSSDVEKSNAFQIILLGSKCGPNEKRLSSQLIGRFFKLFKNEQESSFNHLLDLCDDEDPIIRMQAVHDLLQICKSEPAYISRVSDVLSQMFASDDASELHVITLVMFNLLEMDPSGTLAGIFNHIISDDSGIHRENLVKFLMANLKRLPDGKISSELEEFIIQQSNKLLPIVSGSGFVQLISLISSLKSTTSLQARQSLVNKITDHVVQSIPVFNPQVVSSVTHIRDCGKQVVQLLSKNVSAGGFLRYVLVKVIPKVSLVKNPSDQRSILQLLAEFSAHPGVTFRSDEKTHTLLPLYNFLMELLPEPSSGQELIITLEDSGSKKLLVPAFAEECCIYSLLSLLRFNPKFLCTTEAGDDEAAREGCFRLQALRQKVQYTARLIRSYRASIIAELQATFRIEGLSPVMLAEEARRALENIEKMVRCLFRPRVEPEHLSDLTLSWVDTTSTLKRPAPSTTLVGSHSAAKQSPPKLQRHFPVTGRRFGGFQVGRGRARGSGRRRF